jgi:hypothetical protein
MVQSTFSDARNWDSQASLDKVAGQAKSTVEQNFGDLQQQNFRTLSRMGVNPNSGRFASLNNQISMQKALAASGDQAQALRKAIGLTNDTPGEIAKRLEMLVMGCVAPTLELPAAVKLAEAFPIEFLSLTNTISELTGQGYSLGEPKAALPVTTD